MKGIEFFLCCFKWTCVLTAFLMIGYWIHKYVKNDDITHIEYKEYKDTDSVHLPAMSLCFVDPFVTVNGSFKNSSDLIQEDYLKYLRGQKGFNEDYKDTLRYYTTFNISDYLSNITILHNLKNEHKMTQVETYSNLKNCPFITFENNFNGFHKGNFARCFELKVEKNYSRYLAFVRLGFKKTFQEIVSASFAVLVRFSYPGQILLDFRADHIFWENYSDYASLVAFNMDSTEILRRRNKNNDECLEDSIHYDDLRLKKAIRMTGCRPMYYNDMNDVPICDNYDKLSRFDYYNLVDIDPPCIEIPHSSVKLETTQAGTIYGFYSILIGYPKKMKLITQQQAIDIHALIGNIGGYIGLFLGYAIIQLPDMILSLRDLLKERKQKDLVPYFCNSKWNDNAGHKLQNTRQRRLQLRKRRKDNYDLKSYGNMQLQEFSKEILTRIESLEHKMDSKLSSMHESQKDKFTKDLKNKKL